VEKKTKVIMVLETRFPSDERVEKEILTLISRGYEVHLACSSRSKELESEKYKGFHIHRLPLSPLWFKLSALVLILPAYLRKWTRFAEKLQKTFDFNIVHIHDLPLSKVGFRLQEKFGLKLVCDQHEYYSNWIVDTAHYNTFSGRIVKFLSRWKNYERRALLKADLVITVAEPLREQYISEYQLSAEKVITLPNTPSKEVFVQNKVDEKLFPEYKENFVLLYFGGLDILRGIDNIIKAIPAIILEIPNFKFVIAGKTSGGYDPVRTSIEMKVEEYVDYLGWLDIQQLPSLIAMSNLGVFTPPSDRTEINKTIATKNYQFLVMNKPILVGKAIYMKEFTEKNGIGLSIDEENTEEIANAIIDFASDKGKQKRMVDQCSKIGPEYYWENTAKSLISGYKKLID
jgi:glycosyltransferase involved in cell wall biosynthesis